MNRFSLFRSKNIEMSEMQQNKYGLSLENWNKMMVLKNGVDFFIYISESDIAPF